MADSLHPDTATLTTPLFTEQGAEDLFARLYSELKVNDPVLAHVIGSEALRLFGNDTVLRARATRFVVEILHIIEVDSLESLLRPETS